MLILLSPSGTTTIGILYSLIIMNFESLLSFRVLVSFYRSKAGLLTIVVSIPFSKGTTDNFDLIFVLLLCIVHAIAYVQDFVCTHLLLKVLIG